MREKRACCRGYIQIPQANKEVDCIFWSIALALEWKLAIQAGESFPPSSLGSTWGLPRAEQVRQGGQVRQQRACCGGAVGTCHEICHHLAHCRLQGVNLLLTLDLQARLSHQWCC